LETKKKRKKKNDPPLLLVFFSKSNEGRVVTEAATVGCDRFPLGDFKHF